MTVSQQALGAFSIGLCCVIAGLLFRRQLARVSYTWTAYLLVVASSDSLILFFPATFWTWGFWTGKELLLAVLKLFIALEIGALAFVRFPGAHRTARTWAALALGATATLMAFAPRTAQGGLAGLALEAHARLSHGSALLLISVGLLVLWYRVPVHRLHRAILRGLATYLLLFSGVLRTALSFLARGEVSWWWVVTGLDGLAYQVMLSYWTWEVWRVAPEDEERGSPALERRLSWRGRLVKE